ncbi:hypothetical protein [Agriterribacter sp.]|uniref:hypothetical protein n=1 Tax=Agriterribacter sp. TaxID=2821509 RepID=UPI002C066368|nr:hypothetical protein [Agriterribacter sp.]HRO44588.1 hypothetical protein [Agriterribacter sp.]HRQ16025.1 hypothetical protein [Agriterribacter sp.]
MKYILYILLGYVLYRFITGFLFPVFRTGKQIKKQFDEMQQRMQDNNMQQPSAGSPSPQQQSARKSPVGEYIDFEEVK